MALTDHCDLYGAVGEAGVNRVISHFTTQRPSLFNYATTAVAHDAELWCQPVPHTPDVTNHGNPLFTMVNPVPVLGADAPPVGLNFCAQLTKADIDFFPGNTIPLPQALNPPLADQHFSLLLRVCGGIECPTQDAINQVPPGGQLSDQRSSTAVPVKEIVLQGRLGCFCLDVIAIGHIQRQMVGDVPSLLAQVDQMDVVGVEPVGLEENLVCYLKTTVNVVLREKLTIAIQKLMLSFSLFGLSTVTLASTPNPPIPDNPAVEDDQVKAFMTMTSV